MKLITVNFLIQVIAVSEGSHGTVGAVVMDFDRNLAAATSTGGMLGNEVGRIGDSPIAGMGVFADNNLGISIYLKIWSKFEFTTNSMLANTFTALE